MGNTDFCDFEERGSFMELGWFVVEADSLIFSWIHVLKANVDIIIKNQLVYSLITVLLSTCA